ncbi:MAG TPA: baseplate J/gp47 family protein [Candidatus Binatia bacterium]|nr:baseplate J/gp47 family protein [Candidatus Binatia bacterium]
MADGTTAPNEPGATPLTLVYLDVDDEITSAASRIRAAGADEVALVLPFGSRLATSRINFRLLAREAGQRGKKIEIITADASARSLAAAAGLPVHPSVSAFEAHRSGVDPEALGAGDAGGAGGNGAGPAAAGGTAPSVATATAAGIGGAAATGVVARSGEPLPLPTPDLDDTRSRVLSGPRRKPQQVPLVGPPRPPIRPAIAIAVGLAVVVTIIAGGLLALELLPEARITLHPRAEAIGPIDLLVEAREDVSSPDPAKLTIPAERFTFPLEAEDTFPATGLRVEDTKARGHVTFSNFDTGRANRIDAGSIVSTESGIEFVTLATVTLPNATIQFPFTIVPSTSSVEVEAVVAGPSGNVGNNTIVVVPRGENRRLLQVTNVEATSGGAHNEITIVSVADVEAAQDVLLGALLDDLDASVAAREGIPEGVTIFEATAAAGEAQWSVDPATLVGTEVEVFQLGATAEGSVLGVDPAPIEALAEAQLAARVDEGWSIQEGSVDVQVGLPDAVAGTITYPVRVGATQVRDVDVDALLAAIRGLGIPEARALLEDYGDVVMEVSPDWVTTIPTRADRVTLELGAPQPSEAP